MKAPCGRSVVFVKVGRSLRRARREGIRRQCDRRPRGDAQRRCCQENSGEEAQTGQSQRGDQREGAEPEESGEQSRLEGDVSSSLRVCLPFVHNGHAFIV